MRYETERKRQVKNLKKYLYVMKTQILKSIAYNYSVYGNILMQTIIMITASFFWKALYANSSNVGGVDVESMITYTVVSSMLSVVMFTNVERRIQNSVKLGTVATDLMKPINLFQVYFAEDMGTVIALLFQNLIPIFLIGSFVIKVPVMADVNLLPYFLSSVFASVMINWLVAALFGMIAFTAIEIDALIQVKKHLLRLLSGSIIPLWFFPESIRKVLELFPFVYIYQLPISIYIGRDSAAVIRRQILVQYVWLGILMVLFLFVQRSVTKKVMVQGG